MFSGQLPFQANDPLAWVHCHLARAPAPLHVLVPDIPRVVSDLVLKLLAKVPEERYQSATGLLADLAHCLARWQATGDITPFALGTEDVPGRFQIPPKLYGREHEIAVLLTAFDTVADTGTPMFVTVAGYSGVGKSAVVDALQQPIVERRGYFIAGKFDQYQRDIPYATLAQAFGRLVRQLLSETDAHIAHWGQAIGEALGPNGQLMVNLVPQLELIIGQQSPVPDLSPQEAQGRFQLVFRRFINAFARQAHPLVLFLDDLQWVDTGTLVLLADLATQPDLHHLMVIGAYRDNEVDGTHPLRQALEAIRQAGAKLQEIVLAPLDTNDVAQLIGDSMKCPSTEAQPLAQLVLNKTGGNPFFTRQFLSALADEKLLQFDATERAWRWNLPRIHAKGYTDNVVDLMVGKLARLAQDAQDALARFACLGNAADAATLGIVLECSAEVVHVILREPERVGLVYRQDDAYAFLHDRVQEAAYSLIPQASQAGMHLRLGRLLASGLPPEAIADRIFEVVSQLNRGVAFIADEPERENLAELNLLAGRRAKESTAYASAMTYFMTGADLLAADCWERRHELAFPLELHRAECEFLTGALTTAEERSTALSARAADTVEQATVACLRIDLYTTLGQCNHAIAVGLDYLRHLGIDWSPHPTEAEARREYERLWSKLGGRAIETLIHLPLMTDPASLATLDVLIKLEAPAEFTDMNLMALVVCRAVNLCLDHGNTDAAPHGYAMLGMVLGSNFGDYRAGFRFGKVGLGLVEQRGLDRFKARVHLVCGGYLMHWTQPIHTCRSLIRRAFDEANELGDLTYASYCCNSLITHLLACGDPLADVQRETETAIHFLHQAQFGLVAEFVTAQLQLVRTLRGLTPTFGTFDDEQFDERRIEARFACNHGLAMAECFYWIRKLQARFLAGDHATAMDAASRAQPLLWTSVVAFEKAEYHFYGALSCAASCDAMSARNAQHWEALANHHRQIEICAQNCPQNFENRAALTGAEIARIEGRELDAERLYEKAIRSARKNGFVHNEGIAHELAARFYLARDLPTSGHGHLEQAQACYAQWGADGKVKQLEEAYPLLRARAKRTAVANETRLDLLSVAKASQAISGCIVLDELIDILMRLILENAGAQTCCLLLNRADELALAAEARAEQQAVQVHRHAGQPPSEGELPLAMLQFVRRSREPVVLMDAGAAHPFAADPYFAQRHPQSVLCLPILSQSALVGILYLENDLVTHAFAPDRVKVLELLASQAAISLENARLYADVRDSHARIRRLVDSNIIGLIFWDLSGNITDANNAFLEMVGYSRQDLLAGGVNWESMTLPEYRALDERKLKEVRETRTCTPYEKEFVRKDGSRVPVLIGAVLFDDSPDQGVAFVLDLSERKQAQEEREARQAAEAANRAKSAFLANMNHELRTPLNGILGYAQILERDRVLGPRQLAGVNVIRKSGDQLLTLINDILDLSKIEADKVILNPLGFPFRPFVQGIVDIVGVNAAQKGMELVCDIPPDVPQGIRADETRLRQVLLNLLSNAVKFSEVGRITLRVRFAPPARLGFEVQDTGIGISTDQLEAVFEPFKQVGEMRHCLGGTGLGLAISRRYVRLMGGDIQVDSRLGHGSTFRFEVEAQPVQTAAATGSARAVIGYAGPRKKILVVDDIAESRAVVTDLLTPLGFEVVEAANGHQGVELAQRLLPDLIVMDIVMPALDGLAATRRLRQQDAFRNVPILAMSASVSADGSEQSLAAGMNAFLPKPLDADKLLEQVARLLQLEWICEKADAPSGARPIVAPPANELEVLHRWAKMGNMREIVAEADRIAGLDEAYRPFASQLSLLANGYQWRAVLRLVEDHRKAVRLPK